MASRVATSTGPTGQPNVARQLRGLMQASVAISSVHSSQEVLQVITDQVRQVIGAHMAITILRVAHDGAQAAYASSFSDQYSTQGRQEPCVGDGRSRTLNDVNQPIRLTEEELKGDPAWNSYGSPPVRGWLAAPLLSAEGGNIGMVQLFDKYEGDFTVEDESILVQLAQFASVALENVRLYRQAQEQLAIRERAQEELRLYRSIVASASDAIGIIDRHGIYREQNASHRKLLGFTDEELRGQTPAVHMGVENFRRVAEALETYGSFRGEITSRNRSGTKIDLDVSAFSMRNEAGEVVCHVGIKRDISERKRAEREIRARVRQQAAVVEFGHEALAGAEPEALMDYGVRLVAQTLEVEYCKLLELLPEGKAFLLRAGVGWNQGLVGTALVGAGSNSQAGYTLLCTEPVIVEDLRADRRFNGPQLLLDHGVVSGMSVMIGRPQQPFGVLGAHTRAQRRFNLDDINFLQAIANVLATAIERRNTEVALHRNEQRLLMAQKATRLAAWEWEITSNRIQFTEGGPNLYGVPPAQIPDLDSWISMLHPEDRHRIVEDLHRAVREGVEYNGEFRITWPDGSTHWLVGRGNVIRDEKGAPVRMVGINLEVTERKQAEEALRQSEHRFRRAQKSANIGAYDWNITSGEVTWSEELPVLQGLAPDRRFQTWLRHVHPEDRGRLHAEIDRALRECSEFDVQVRFLLPDHSVVWVVSRGQVFCDDQGRPAHVLGIVMDITARKQTETMLQRSEKLAMVGRLAATIAHEINNPLESITNLLYLIENHPGLDETARQYASLAQTELHRVSHIARQTLGFHRESARPVPVNVCEIVDNVLRLYERKIAASEVHVERRFECKGEILAFPAEMRQVFSNLLLNALEAVGQRGKVSIHIHESANWNRPVQRGLRVAIADNGPGIPAEHREHIFEPFFTTKGEKGTGLGLWVSSGIVQKHGGSLRLRTSTRPGRSGTCFSIFFPGAQPSLDAEPRSGDLLSAA